MNEQEKLAKIYEKNLKDWSQLQTLQLQPEWSLLIQLIDRDISTAITRAMGDECKKDHDLYLYHKATFDALTNFKAKFTNIERLGKEAAESIERINES